MTEQDVEGVADDERAHEHGDERERQQHVAEDVDDGGEVLLVLRDDDVTGHGLDIGGQYFGQSVDQHLGFDVGRDVDEQDLILAAVESLEFVERERRQHGPGEGVLLAEPAGSDQLERFAAVDADDVVGFADHETLVVGRGLVERELTGTGVPALDQFECVEFGVLPVEGEDRGQGLDRAAVGLERDHLQARRDRDRLANALDPLDDVEHGFVHRAIAQIDLRELVPCPHLDVDLGVGVLHDRVERAGETIGEHERGDHEADAENDGEGGE